MRVQARDASADVRFVFAVRTTGVFCRPSSRTKMEVRKK
ncbi:Ada metal-binding domain-containing protein, partial [Salmonella enterica]